MKFTVGMEVYSLNYRTAEFTVHTVTKVNKGTGNFTIDGGKQQYRQDGFMTASHRYNRYQNGLEPLTPEKHEELKAKRAARERHYAFDQACLRLSRINWETEISEEQLEAVLKLVTELVKPAKTA